MQVTECVRKSAFLINHHKKIYLPGFPHLCSTDTCSMYIQTVEACLHFNGLPFGCIVEHKIVALICKGPQVLVRCRQENFVWILWDSLEHYRHNLPHNLLTLLKIEPTAAEPTPSRMQGLQSLKSCVWSLTWQSYPGSCMHTLCCLKLAAKPEECLRNSGPWTCFTLTLNQPWIEEQMKLFMMCLLASDLQRSRWPLGE